MALHIGNNKSTFGKKKRKKKENINIPKPAQCHRNSCGSSHLVNVKTYRTLLMQTPPAHIIQHSWNSAGCCHRHGLMLQNYIKKQYNNNNNIAMKITSIYLVEFVVQCCHFKTAQQRITYRFIVTEMVYLISRVTNTEKQPHVFLFPHQRANRILPANSPRRPHSG